MVVFWSKKARYDIGEFIFTAHIHTKKTAKMYIKSLVKYTNTLENMPKLGKIIFLVDELEIRQIIYKKHRILYYITSNIIVIVSVLHTKRDINTFIKYLKRNI